MEFGTAGLRGILGIGTNRMNKYVVAKTAQAIADVIKDEGSEAMSKGIAISYDIRHFSKEFAKISASIFAGNGIKVYIYKTIHTTPQLSYAVRNLKTKAGVMVTASHNPKDYNGYKVYWDKGSQILDDIADKIVNKQNQLKGFNDIKTKDFDKALNLSLIHI